MKTPTIPQSASYSMLRILLILSLSLSVSACSNNESVKKTGVSTYTASTGAILESDRIMSVVE